MITALNIVKARIASEFPTLFDIKALPSTLEVDGLGTRLKFELVHAGGSAGVNTYRCDTVFHKIPLVCYFVVQPAGSRRASSIFTTASIVRRDTGASQRASTPAYRNKFKSKLEVLEQLGASLNGLFRNLLKYEQLHDKAVIVEATKTAKKLGYDVYGAASAYEPAIELGYRDMLVVIRARNLKYDTQPIQMTWTAYRLNPKKPVKQDSKRYDRISGYDFQPEYALFGREFKQYAVEAKKAVDALLDVEDRATARVAGEHRNHSLENFPKQLKLRGVVYSLTNASDLMTKHYSSKEGGSLAFRWYMSHETYETYSVVTRTKSEEGHFVNRTFDVNLNRGDWTRDQLERWLEAGMSMYASRAHARVAADAGLATFDDPPKQLNVFGYNLKLLDRISQSSALGSYLIEGALFYGLGASAGCGLIFWRSTGDKRTCMCLVFNEDSSYSYAMRSNLDTGVSRKALENEIEQRVVGLNLAKISKALDAEA